MREFVVVGHDAPTTPDFELDALASGAGRLDVLCRCVGAALFLSHDIRTDVRVHLVLGDEVTVRFDGETLRNAHPDERNLAALIRGALEAVEEAVGHQPAASGPGVSVVKFGLAETLDAVDGVLVELHEEGTPLVDVAPPPEPVFVLSDHRDFTDAEAALLADRAAHRVSLGPERIHAEHAVTVAHNYLDTEGYTRY
jgi:tRNA (pseudouridine54-N1)-methyltransferase